MDTFGCGWKPRCVPSDAFNKIEKLVTGEYNHAIIDEIDWWRTEAKQDVFTFNKADVAVSLATANGMTVEGDNLVYAYSDFKITFLGNLKDLNRDTLLGIMKRHINQLASHFKGRITQYCVVNEYRTDPVWDKFNSIIGPDYVDVAFQTARDADPDASLYYNDAFNETMDLWAYEQTKNNTQRLKNKGLINAVGLQMVLIDAAKPPAKEKFIATMKSYGLPVIISSLNVYLTNVQGTDEERSKKKTSRCLHDGFRGRFRIWCLSRYLSMGRVRR